MDYLKTLNFNELLAQVAAAPGWTQGLLLALATFFISEDLTTLAAGLMVSQGQLTWSTAFWGCFLGIFLGDGLLYVLGLWVGRPVLKWPLFRRILSEERVKMGEKWFEENGIAVVFISRFLPGTRLPTYFAAGLMGAKARFFMITALVASAIWTPLLLGLAWWFGHSVLLPFEFMQAHPLLTFGLGFTLLVSVFYLVQLLLKADNRRFLRDRLHRLTHWEFWPLKVFYTPIFIYNLWCSIRFRSLHAPLYSNLAIPFSGFAGESKSSILDLFNSDPLISPHILYDPSKSDIETTLKEWETLGFGYPLIVKPDVGQRGQGVMAIKNLESLKKTCLQATKILVLQKYEPGPHEFGISYVRLPNEENGRISGITGKMFPEITGDGKSTMKELVVKNPHIKGRLKIFRKYMTEDVMEEGETFKLVELGNHCLGTIFNDQSHLITKQLEKAVDRLAKMNRGLQIGRFDVRASDLKKFQEEGLFKVIEFNGATSEPAYVYDPSYTIFGAYGTFFKYWKQIWIIGSHNRANASAKLKWRDLYKYNKVKSG